MPRAPRLEAAGDGSNITATHPNIVVFILPRSRLIPVQDHAPILTSVLGIGAIFYATTTTVSILVTSSHSVRLSPALLVLFISGYSQFYAPVPLNFFLKGWILLQLQHYNPYDEDSKFFLGKIHPYQGEDFVKGFADVPEDPVQLHVSASALKWLHSNAPDSYHSEENDRNGHKFVRDGTHLAEEVRQGTLTTPLGLHRALDTAQRRS